MRKIPTSRTANKERVFTGIQTLATLTAFNLFIEIHVVGTILKGIIEKGILHGKFLDMNHIHM